MNHEYLIMNKSLINKIITIFLDYNNELLKIEYFLITISLLIALNLINLIILKSSISYIKYIRLNIMVFIGLYCLVLTFNNIFFVPNEYLLDSIELLLFEDLNIQLLLKFLWCVTSFGLILTFLSTNPFLQISLPLLIVNGYVYLLNKWFYANFNEILIENTFMKWKKVANKDYCKEKVNLIINETKHLNEIIKNYKIDTFINDFEKEIYSKSKEELSKLIIDYYTNLSSNKSKENTTIKLNLEGIKDNVYFNSTTINLVLIIIALTTAGFGVWKIFSYFNIDFSSILNIFTNNEQDPLSPLNIADRTIRQVDNLSNLVGGNGNDIWHIQQQILLLRLQYKDLNDLLHVSLKYVNMHEKEVIPKILKEMKIINEKLIKYDENCDFILNLTLKNNKIIKETCIGILNHCKNLENVSESDIQKLLEIINQLCQ